MPSIGFCGLVEEVEAVADKHFECVAHPQRRAKGVPSGVIGTVVERRRSVAKVGAGPQIDHIGTDLRSFQKLFGDGSAIVIVSRTHGDEVTFAV